MQQHSDLTSTSTIDLCQFMSIPDPATCIFNVKLLIALHAQLWFVHTPLHMNLPVALKISISSSWFNLSFHLLISYSAWTLLNQDLSPEIHVESIWQGKTNTHNLGCTPVRVSSHNQTSSSTVQLTVLGSNSSSSFSFLVKELCVFPQVYC
jgi:hypothetical protein